MSASGLGDMFDIALPVREPERSWRGIRHPSRTYCFAAAVQIGRDAIVRELHPTGRHSSGFEWAYRGSGPTELALVILADYLQVDPPADLYVDFRDQFIATAPAGGFTVYGTDIAAWLGRRLRSLG